MELVRNNSLPAGFRVHWYEIESILGEGGFGITYLAHDRNLDQKVAVKEYFPKELASRSTGGTVHTAKTDGTEVYEWGLSRFLIEARTLAKFRHPNIVFVYSVFEENQTAYMVMEHLSGGSLAKAFKNQRFDTEEELLRILFPLLDGIKEIHDAGFIHRDIKPANILLRNTGEPVLLDFGSARQSLGAKTRMLTSLVSPGFTPFEQYSDGSETEKQGPWTDLYSLAATLYMGLFDKCPVDALKRTSAILAGTADPFLPAAKAGKGKFSPQFLNAIDKALLFYPEKRPQSVESFLDLLPGNRFKELNRKVAPQQLKTPVIERKPLQQTLADKPPALAPRNRWSPAIRYRWLAGLGAALVLGVAAYNFVDVSPTPPTETPVVKRAENPDIDQLLDDARQDLIASRLIAPPGNNALERFRIVIEIEPGNAEAQSGLEGIVSRYIHLAERAVSRNQYDTGRQYLDQASEILPGADSISTARRKLDDKWKKSDLLGRINGLLEKADRNLANLRLSSPPGNNALENFRAILALDPKNPDAIQGLEQIVDRYIRLAENAISRERFEQASEFLEKAKEIQPGAEKVERVSLALNEILSTKKRIQEINRLLTAAKENFARLPVSEPSGHKAVQLFNEVLKLEPDNLAAKQGLKAIVDRYVKFAEKAIRKEQFTQSKRFLNKARAISPNAENVIEADTRLAEAISAKRKRDKINNLLADANKDLKASRLTDPPGNNALEDYKSVLALDATNDPAKKGLEKIADQLIKLAEQSIGKAQFVEASELLAQAESIRPDSSKVSDLYRKLAKAKQTAETRHKIELLLTDANKDFEASRLNAPIGRNARARFNAVLRLDPSNEEAKRGLQKIVDRYVEFANKEISSGNLEVAEEHLDTANGILPDDKTVASSLDLLATARLNRKKSDAINSLLAAANRDLAAGRLSAPVGSNAIERFNAVLKIDKENAKARQGIENIIDRYAQLADKALSKGQLDTADAYLDKSDTVLTSEAGSLIRFKKTLIAESRDAVSKQRQSILERSQKRIGDLLAAANQDMAEYRYSAPKGNNAMERFQAILEIEPENQGAIEGLRKIVERYLYRADRETVKRNFERAQQNIEKATTVIPSLRTFTRIHETLNKTRAAAVERLSDEKKRSQIQRDEATAKEKQDSIERLLNFADQDLKGMRLVSPTNSNAYDRYKQVLDLDPNNQEAILGLKKIVAQHIELADDAASRKRFDEAKSLLATAARIQPETPELVDAQNRLDAVIEDDKRARAQKAKPTLSESDVLGNWCSDAFELKLERAQWTFQLSDENTTTYSVERYAFNDDSVLIYWRNQEDASMITELGNFATGADKVARMTQVRGKANGAKVWHAYNRVFRRCR